MHWPPRVRAMARRLCCQANLGETWLLVQQVNGRREWGHWQALLPTVYSKPLASYIYIFTQTRTMKQLLSERADMLHRSKNCTSALNCTSPSLHSHTQSPGILCNVLSQVFWPSEFCTCPVSQSWRTYLTYTYHSVSENLLLEKLSLIKR